MNLFRRLVSYTVVRNTLRSNVINKKLHKYVYNNVNITSKALNLRPNNVTYDVIRCKSKQQYDSDDENISLEDDSSLSKDSKVVKFSTTSMRTDVIIKSALSISRNKIEQMFYESKIRVNGKKILKKSASIRVGDEVDLIKMVSSNNPDHLFVSRIEVLSVVPKEDSISVTARRFKNLLIENYDNDPYKSSTAN